MVFNATFNNISFISSGSVLLVEETGRRKPPIIGSYISPYHTIMTTMAPTANATMIGFAG